MYACMVGCVCCQYRFIMFICERRVGMCDFAIRACTSTGSKFVFEPLNFWNSLDIWDLLSSLILTFCSKISISRGSFSSIDGQVWMTFVYSW